MLEVTVVDEDFIRRMDLERSYSGKGILRACSVNPVLFSEKMLGVRLRSWQVAASIVVRDICNEEDPVKKEKMIKRIGLMTSRQIGKSEWLAIMSLWLCIFNKYPGDLNQNIHSNTIVGVISATDDQAKKLISRIRRLINRGDKFIAKEYQENGVPLFGASFFSDLLDPSEMNNTGTITFKSWKESVHGEFILRGSTAGSTIKSTAPTGRVLGETFSVYFLDEAGRSEYISDSFHDDDLSPTGDALGALRIYLSTPWQNSGFFYRIMNPDDVFEDIDCVKLVFTIDAIKFDAPSHYERVMEEIEQKKANGLFDEVQRAYYCRFVKGESSYFKPEKVHAAFKDYGMFTSYPGKCDLGIDFGGQVKSKTVVTISKYDEKAKVITRLYHRVYPVGQDLSLMDDVTDLMTRFNIQRIIPEDCPAGDHINRLMIEKGWNVHPMNPRSDKVKKYGAFRAALNRGEIQSYLDNSLKVEMLSMEFSNSSKQSIIQHAPGMSDDIIDSFVMSCYFFVQEESNRVRFINFEA